MRNTKAFAAMMIATTLMCATARADDDDGGPQEMTRGKPGLIVTGALLSVFGGAHMALAASAFDSASHGSFFASTDAAIGGISAAIGGVLLLTGIPLIVYGATATHKTHVDVGVGPRGLTLGGTF